MRRRSCLSPGLQLLDYAKPDFAGKQCYILLSKDSYSNPVFAALYIIEPNFNAGLFPDYAGMKPIIKRALIHLLVVGPRADHDFCRFPGRQIHYRFEARFNLSHIKEFGCIEVQGYNRQD